MHLHENILFDLDLGVKVTVKVAQYPLHHVTYSGTKFEVASSNGLGGATSTRKYIIRMLTLTLGSRSHKMLLSTLYFYVTYSGTKFEFATSNGPGGDAFTKKKYLTVDPDLGPKVTRNVVQYPLLHVAYLGTKFEGDTSNGLGGDAFTRKCIFGVPSSSCELARYKVLSCFAYRFRRCIYKVRDGQTKTFLLRIFYIRIVACKAKSTKQVAINFNEINLILSCK